MTKLAQLTPEHQKILDDLCAEARNEILSYKPLGYNTDLRKDVDWLYNISGLKEKPLILIFDSFYESQVAANYCAIINNLLKEGKTSRNQVRNQVWNQVENQVRNQVENQVWNQVWNQVENQVRNQVENQVWNQVWNQVRNQVENQVWNQVENQVRNQVENQVWNQVWNQVDNQVRNQVDNQVRNQVENQVWNQVRNQVWNQVRNQVENQVWNQVRNQVWNQVSKDGLVFFSQYFGLYSESFWITFYEFFKRIDVIKGEDFTRWRSLLRRGIYNIIFLENFCIVTRVPTTVKLSDKGLHSTNGKAFEWKNGEGFHFIHGVLFDEKLWTGVVNRKLSPEQVLQIENIEQRRIAINHYGWDVIFDQLDKKLVDTSKRGNKLYSVKGLVPNDTILVLNYSCPSTQRQYVSPVPDLDDCGNRMKKADQAMAWKFSMSESEYMELTIEA